MEKNNPDILQKFTELQSSRSNMIFNPSNVIYNPITNDIPSNIKETKDLLLNINNEKQNLNKLLLLKEHERNSINIKYQTTTNNINDQNKCKTFDELKYMINRNKNLHDNVLDDLKNLGILD